MENDKLIYSLMPKVMEDIGAIGKDRKNEKQGYKFRGIDDVYNAANSALSKHGVFPVPRVLEESRTERTNSNGTLLFYVYMKVSYTFYAKDGSYIESVVSAEAFDSGDKATNKAMSAAQKYAFLQIFCIPTEEQKDSEIDDHEFKAPKSTPKTSEKPKSESKVASKAPENVEKKPVEKTSPTDPYSDYLSEINTALSLNHLKEIWSAVNKDYESDKLSDKQYDELKKAKDTKKESLK